jgi:hypothetical protein
MSLLHWIIALAGFELLSFVVFGLSIATAVPGEDVATCATASVSKPPRHPNRILAVHIR